MDSQTPNSEDSKAKLYIVDEKTDVYVAGIPRRDGMRDITNARRGDDYYVRYDAIDSTRSDDRLTAEIAFVGSMI